MSNTLFIVIVAVVLTISHVCVYYGGKSSVYSRFKDDNITILKGGNEVDLQVYQADDDRLCQLLGGCLPKSVD